jgi:hypothetical protein
MTFSPEDLRKLLELLEVTTDEEIDCQKFLNRVAGYIERLGPDGTPPPGYEDVIQHLRVCPECCEEFDALYRTLRNTGSTG